MWNLIYHRRTGRHSSNVLNFCGDQMSTRNLGSQTNICRCYRRIDKTNIPLWGGYNNWIVTIYLISLVLLKYVIMYIVSANGTHMIHKFCTVTRYLVITEIYCINIIILQQSLQQMRTVALILISCFRVHLFV